MCSILGISFQNGCTMHETEIIKHTLKNLFANSQIRGTDATGVAFILQKDIIVLKNNVGARKFLADSIFDSTYAKYTNSQTISIIGHCRMKTKGTEKDKHNNHPIITDNIVGVHNGIIDNDEELFISFQQKKQTLKRRGKVDSEIIFRLIDHYVHIEKEEIADAIRSTTPMLEGSYACAFVDRDKPHLLWLFRNENPISIYHYTKHGVIIFSSSEYYIQNAVEEVKKCKLSKPTKIELPRWHGVGINLKTNSIYEFKLQNNRKDNNVWSGCGYP